MIWTILAMYGMLCVGFTLGYITCAGLAGANERIRR